MSLPRELSLNKKEAHQSDDPSRRVQSALAQDTRPPRHVGNVGSECEYQGLPFAQKKEKKTGSANSHPGNLERTGGKSDMADILSFGCRDGNMGRHVNLGLG